MLQVPLTTILAIRPVFVSTVEALYNDHPWKCKNVAKMLYKCVNYGK